VTSRPAAEAAKHLSLRERLFASRETKALESVIDSGIDRVEKGLADQVKFTHDVADPAARYLIDAGGKRVRPMLALLTAQLGTGITDDVVTAAQAIEITHIASLYHDDVMDDAPLRRGVESAHIVYGNSIAILTGDLLFARASTLMARLGERAIQLQAETFERLCIGQLNETVGPKPGDDPVAHYIKVLDDKTGSLIVAAARAGLIFSGGDLAYEQPLIGFGNNIGVAFQLADDVIDLSPDAATGKQAGTDLKAGVPTLPTLYLAERAQTDRAAADLQERIRAAVEEDDDAALASLTTELYHHPVTQATRDRARAYASDAVAALAPLPDGAVKQALTAFADHVVSRTN
jgi:heptaprenyl diphosphate synthase